MNETKNYIITKSGAVILEGGANRGVFTAGALDFLMEQEYYIPHVIGVSAGACNALDYVSRQIGRTRDCMIVTDEKNRYVNKNIKTIVEKKALLDMDMEFERYPYEIFPFDFDTYFASPQTCELVVTNCETGRAEYLDDRENKERLLAIGRASSSMPIACPLFELDADGGFARVAGCPPDYFSAEGQLWGNPLYNWPYHKQTGYAWWIQRVRHALGIYDLLRIDHFRGFEFSAALSLRK